MKKTKPKVTDIPNEPIAIVGMAGRFPGAKNLSEFWDLIAQGKSSITPMEESRSSAFPKSPGLTAASARHLWWGKLDGVDKFDASFFGISPREASLMDPQQRLSLQVAYEALEDAGMAHISNSQKVGVVVGVINNEYQDFLVRNVRGLDALTATGGARSSISGRISHAFDLNGLSLTIDSDRSSSLVALHLACQSLQSSECDTFIVGGVNLILNPSLSNAFSKSMMLSSDGVCRFGDKDANGFVRSEGVAFIVLKTRSAAKRDNDRIYAEILGVSVSQQGHASHDIKVPSQSAQQQVIYSCYKKAGISPKEVDYIEAHGTGTPAGDLTELKSIGSIMSSSGREKPCWVGSVKTNIGHTEAAAGLAGLIKTVLSLHKKQMPPSLNFSQPQSGISLEKMKLEIPSQMLPWPQSAHPRLAAVSSFGLTGTISHLVLRESLSDKKSEPRAKKNSSRKYLLPLSSKTSTGLKKNAEQILNYLASAPEMASDQLEDLCYTASLRRTHHPYRLTVSGFSADEMKASLQQYCKNVSSENIVTASKKLESKKILFVFPGPALEPQRLAEMLKIKSSVFKSSLEECKKILSSLPGAPPADLRGFWTVACYISLAELWKSWGVQPEGVLGRGLGEVAAACVAGIISLREAISFSTGHFDSAAKDRSTRSSRLKFFSNSTGQMEHASALGLEYWKTVSSESISWSRKAIGLLVSHGFDIFIDTTLVTDLMSVSAFQEPFSEVRASILTLPETGTQPTFETKLLECLAKLHCHQVEINWRNQLQGECRLLTLPAYSWDEKSYWYTNFHHDENQPELRKNQWDEVEEKQFRKWLQESSPQQRRELISSFLLHQIAHLMGSRFPENLEPLRSLSDQGLTVQEAEELFRKVGSVLGKTIPDSSFNHLTTLSMLTLQISDLFDQALATQVTEPLAVIGLQIELSSEISAISAQSFENSVFDLSPSISQTLRPIERQVLQAIWKTLEASGAVPSQMAGSRTGVFFAVGSNPQELPNRNLADLAAQVFGWVGPTVAFENNETSSLTALHYACQSLRTGETDLALVGGIHSRGDVVLLLLKKASSANQSRDQVQALISGSSVLHSGRKSLSHKVSTRTETPSLQEALNLSGITITQLSHYELQGPTIEGEPGSQETPAKSSLRITKQTLEPAQSLEAIARLILSMHGSSNEQNAAVGSMSSSGLNAHIILKKPLKLSEVHASNENQLLVLSAQTLNSLEALQKSYISFLTHSEGKMALSDICYSAARKRSHFPFRLAVSGSRPEEIASRLSTLNMPLESQAPMSLTFAFHSELRSTPLTTRYLFDSQAEFRKVVEPCLRSFAILGGDEEALKRSLFEENPKKYQSLVHYIQSLAIAAVLKSWGIIPSRVVGCGLGLVAAAQFCGNFSLEDGVKLLLHIADSKSFPSARINEINFLPIQLPIHSANGTELSDRLASHDFWSSIKDEDVKAAADLFSLQKMKTDFILSIYPSNADPFRPGIDCQHVKLTEDLGKSSFYPLFEKLYTSGWDLSWANIYKDTDAKFVSIPTYPFAEPKYNPTSSKTEIEELDDRAIKDLLVHKRKKLG